MGATGSVRFFGSEHGTSLGGHTFIYNTNKEILYIGAADPSGEGHTAHSILASVAGIQDELSSCIAGSFRYGGGRSSEIMNFRSKTINIPSCGTVDASDVHPSHCENAKQIFDRWVTDNLTRAESRHDLPSFLGGGGRELSHADVFARVEARHGAPIRSSGGDARRQAQRDRDEEEASMFDVGDRVQCRDGDYGEWQSYEITSLYPTEAGGMTWEHIRPDFGSSSHDDNDDDDDDDDHTYTPGVYPRGPMQFEDAVRGGLMGMIAWSTHEARYSSRRSR